ncbi:hypothetical protein [Roseovarius salinarum]|uniref:hypothetical protein n=1 Tax=Roseovarius salinarum TaxID=1981892 RepID=UPI000C3210FF|nr:hypothetical protein [Roseovarius salinarum]
MTGISRAFMLLAILSAIIGMGWGIMMAATQDHTLAPAHAHLNLLGWVSFAIFAFYYHLVPGAAAGWLARLHVALSVVGVAVLIPGIVMALTQQGEVLGKLGSVIVLAGMLCFLGVVMRGTADFKPG